MVKVIEVDFVADVGHIKSTYHPLFIIVLKEIDDLYRIAEKQNIPLIFKWVQPVSSGYICSDGRFLYTCWVKENISK